MKTDQDIFETDHEKVPCCIARRTSRVKKVVCAATLLLLFTTSVMTQIRLHDAENEELAKKTRDAFAEFSKGDANVFETMISNTMTLKTATLAQLYELNRQSRRDTVNLIPVLTWKELLVKVTETEGQFLIAYNSSRKILDLNRQNVSTLKAALDEVNKDLTAAKKTKADKEKDLKAEEQTLIDLATSLNNLKDALVTAAKPPKRLSDLSQFNNLKNVWTKFKEAKESLDLVEKNSHAPGLQLTILDLAVQRQQMKVDRLKLALEHAVAAQKRFEGMNKRLEVVWGNGALGDDGRPTQGLFGQIYGNIVPNAKVQKPFVTNENEQVLETIGKLAKQAEDEVGKPLDATMRLRNLLDILSRYLTLVGYQKYLLLSDAIEAGVDEHLFSIRLSAINTKEREMLVGHGLEGLATYYAGGLKPEEVANFFRAAQSIALGVLAGRVQ